MVRGLAPAAALVLAGCVASSTGGSGDWCDLNEPRRHSDAVIQAMTEAELDELNAHNRYGEQRCGWRS